MNSGAALHRKLLTLDAHLDTPLHFARPGWRFDARHTVAADLSQVDLPRMDGALDGGFFVVFVPQGELTPDGYAKAKAAAIRRSDAIDEVLARHPDRIGLALTAADAEALKAAGRTIIFKSMENGYPIGEDLTSLVEFHRRGVRLAGPVHVRNNQLGDSSTDVARWNGLSPLGRDWVKAMSDLGMILDGSHASDAALDQMLDLSRAPMVLSHSSARARYEHPRNIDDARIRRLATAGGVVCASTIFLSAMTAGPERLALLRALDDLSACDNAAQSDIAARWQALNTSAPMWSANFDDYIVALLHLIEVAGIDHVGMGADFDGGGGLAGIEDVTAFPSITERLLERGLSEHDLTKLWGGNLLRVLRAAEEAASPRVKEEAVPCRT